MKLRKKVVPPEDDDSSSSSESSSTSWLLTDSKKVKSAAATAKTLSGSRAPELWIPDGKKVTLWFRDPEPVGSMEVYNLKMGKRFRSFTKPGAGQPDLFASRMGLSPQRKYIYEVVDVDGYIDKKTGKQLRNLPRFFVVGTRLYEQLQGLAEMQDDGTALNECLIRISRTGQSTNTTYTLLPLPRGPGPDTQAVKRIKGQIPQYYSPISLEAQKAIVSSHSSDDGSDD